MKIGPKLIGSFSIVAIICGIVGFVGWYGIGQVDEHMDEIGALRLPAIQAAMTMDAVMGDVATAQMELLNPNAPVEEAQEFYTAIDEAFVEIDKAAADFQDLIADEEDERIFNAIMVEYNSFKDANNEFVNVSKDLDKAGTRNPMKVLFEVMEIENNHREWLFLLSETVVEGFDFEGELNPENCVLGEWMHDHGFENEAIDSKMAGLRDVHDEFHKGGADIVDIFSKSKNDMAKAAAMNIFDNRVLPNFDSIIVYIDEIIGAELMRANDLALQMTNLDGEKLEPTFDATMALLGEANNDIATDANAAREEGDSAASFAFTLIIVSITVGVLLALGFGFVISRGISKPISKVVDLCDEMNEEFDQFVGVVDAIAQNDLTQQIEKTEMAELHIKSKDEIGMLAKAIKGTFESKDKIGDSMTKMTTNLDGMIRQLRDNSTELVSAANEISSSSEQMAQGAKSQTDQAAQVSSAIEEMTATIIQSSKNANEAKEASENASSTSGEGQTVVGETINGMVKIAESAEESGNIINELAKASEGIGEIIGVIDDIADQTNLLALNAAIEAARAGEQGRGFAVVADEVRKLAERTGKATGEITEMIKGIQADSGRAVTSMEEAGTLVEAGKEQADKAGNSLDAINSISQQVTDMIVQIATAADEQSSAAEQISKNMEMISNVSKESAAGAEQSASAAEELNRQAEGMQSMVAQFKVKENA